MPQALKGYVVEGARAADYDALLLGGDKGWDWEDGIGNPTEGAHGTNWRRMRAGVGPCC